MAAEKNFYEIQIKFFEVFKSQDPENDDLDTVFEIDGKKLYANESRLTIISPTFESMLSERWTSKNDESIQIKDYSYNDFYEFLSFIYSGKCNFNDKNIFALIDMAEFYGIDTFKNACAQFLIEMKYSTDNILTVLETSNKYSLIDLKTSVYRFISINFMDFIKSKNILKIQRETLEDLISFVRVYVKPEELFQAVYEWVEHQVESHHLQRKLNIIDFKKEIKAEIIPFLPYIKFTREPHAMIIEFCNQIWFNVQRGFLFSYDALHGILKRAGAYLYAKVKITNLNGQSIYGFLRRDSVPSSIIRSLKNCLSNNQDQGTPWWNTKCKIPSTPSPIKKRNGAEWYLVYFQDGDIGARRGSEIKSNDYLLAEMTTEFSEFHVTHHCKIDMF